VVDAIVWKTAHEDRLHSRQEERIRCCNDDYPVRHEEPLRGAKDRGGVIQMFDDFAAYDDIEDSVDQIRGEVSMTNILALGLQSLDLVRQDIDPETGCRRAA
jgi:hypothetical protein